ncbi:hypothetical protein CPAST_c16460 [Clostridium pasteurianum DSM 525 = ATCC 6013]|uniref:Uncharacterized protein n=1 Tax=Clostridium pasteurianum DSM 525 = ATCC 6013 TaxID=1262449 RepID=A0A0H3J1G5_CLOPA|nr:hypothetical protein [Clostridium pasteurianum]AJA47721.1 hypothetical protein CPAST_c16460 [Clostridium pasteurianum DSM 525 = ATCC 6013]AJA51709.1 hypothetical protein CLPA_c16460 [Clostridium pasteurianum DSM 525 = ATCC 6013]AOZ75021.1 hypothetical protein AQ983_07960 [Clostridium pasteurianum DSM 525 = ATCC 6013]AOZ78816.1 hypothetical protein AQ984_07950 [Clostridium pasteurianum]ELP59623.1 hypothetical protein F502_07153 [Clostridium pasteurianum DSM 525 = ATCC 6013]
MREVGIIKWFGGFNPKIHKLNDFGYILRENQPDLYVNRNHLHCKAKLLTPGTAVSFEVGVNYKNNMEQAFKVKLLKSENDILLIKKCVFSNKEEYYVPLMAKFFQIGYSSDIELVFPKVMNLNKEEQKKIIDSMDLNLKMRKDIFKFLDIEEQIDMLLQLTLNDFIDKWENLSLTTKIFLIYRLCHDKYDLTILEKTREKNLFIRALIIIAWVSNNQDKKSITYKKACEYMYKYSSELSHTDSDYEELKIIFPIGKYNFKVDINKPWYQWSILEFIQYCNCTSILEDMDRGDKAVIMLITALNSFMKRLSL